MVDQGGGAADPACAETHIRTWLADAVVGLNLCPFARPLLETDRLRIVVCPETHLSALQRAFLGELDLLQSSSEEVIATTLLAFPAALSNFEDYLDFLDEAQTLLCAAGLEGLVQLASFHPQYRFEGEAEDAASHYSNRSPYPLIHLLREDMLSQVLAEDSDPDGIPDRNIAVLETIGVVELERRWRAMFDDSQDG